MKNSFLILLSILFSSKIFFAQDYSAVIKLNADSMNRAFLKGDINTILDYTYPKLFEIVGDREFIAHTFMAMQADGFMLDTSTMSSPGPVLLAGNELHSILIQTVYSSFPGGTMKADSPILAVSGDCGLKWYFIDIKQVSGSMLLEIFPAFNKALKIPVIPPPIITYHDTIIDE